jgi:hypothetical protein
MHTNDVEGQHAFVHAFYCTHEMQLLREAAAGKARRASALLRMAHAVVLASSLHGMLHLQTLIPQSRVEVMCRGCSDVLMHADAACCHTGLPQQLPAFLWQAAAIVTGGVLQLDELCSLPMSQTASLVRAVVCTTAHPTCIGVHGVSWQWVEHVLRQLLGYAVSAGLMRALPGGCLPAEATAYSHTISSSSSSSTKSVSAVRAERLMCASVRASAARLFDTAREQVLASKGGGEMLVEFASQPVVAEVALQLLASHCVITHKKLAQWQQQQQQQGRRVRRGLLLLLPQDLQQHVAQLLPAEAMVNAVAAATTADHAANEVPAGEQTSSLVTMLFLHVTSFAASKTDSGISSPALSAAALQLTAVLLLLVATDWQRQYRALTVQQQEQLNISYTALDAAAATEVRQVRQQLAPASALLTQCCQLLQQQTLMLWEDGQWQPQLQLLQQGGGEVLLQGLALAVHCSSAHCELRDNEHLQYHSLLEVLIRCLGAWSCVAAAAAGCWCGVAEETLSLRSMQHTHQT